MPPSGAILEEKIISHQNHFSHGPYRQRLKLYENGKGIRPEFFLLVDLQDIFSDLGSGGRKKRNKKALKMTSWSFSELFFFLLFSELFFFFSFNISSKTVKLLR